MPTFINFWKQLPSSHTASLSSPAILMLRLASRSRFSAFRSLWTILRQWQKLTAATICLNFLRASFSAIRPWATKWSVRDEAKNKVVIHTGSATQTGSSRTLTASDAEDGDRERHGHQRVLQIQTPDGVTAEATWEGTLAHHWHTSPYLGCLQVKGFKITNFSLFRRQLTGLAGKSELFCEKCKGF